MALVRRDPWREIEDMFNRYTRAVGQPQAGSQEVVATGDWAPRVDIAETDKAFVIKAEIPEERENRKKKRKGKSSIESSDTTGASPVALRCLTMSMKLKLRLRSRMAC
jgi:hypothetical protein